MAMPDIYSGFKKTIGQVPPDPNTAAGPQVAAPNDIYSGFGAAAGGDGAPAPDPSPVPMPGGFDTGNPEARSGVGHLGMDTTKEAPPPPPAPPDETPAPPPAPGLLATPGPGEIYDAKHSGDFDTKGATETIYGEHGQDPFSGPSDTQKLFDQGMAGNDPYFSYAQQKGEDSINAAARARGGWNSGAALEQIGNNSANLRGQQALAIYGLAPQADSAERQRMAQGFDFAHQNDTAHADRIGAGMSINDDWQTQEEKRLQGGFTDADTLAAQKAGVDVDSYKQALALVNSDGLAGIEAKLQKAGVNPTGDATKDALTLISLGIKAVA